MSTLPLRLTTEQSGLMLRQLATEADDVAYFAAVDASRDSLSQLGDEADVKHPNLGSVAEARIHPSNPDKLRLGIWNNDAFVGGINLTPDKYGSAAIDYWLDSRHTGHDYATLAAKALAVYGSRRYSQIYASAREANLAGRAVLERAGFKVLSNELGRTIFELSKIEKPPKAPKTKISDNEVLTIRQDLEKYDNLPNRRDALRGKDKDNLTVFLSHGMAKKLYRCPCCSVNIDIGSPHVIMSRVQVSKRYTHHHLDSSCAHNKILPNLRNITIIRHDEASAAAVNARSRRYRYDNRLR